MYEPTVARTKIPAHQAVTLHPIRYKQLTCSLQQRYFLAEILKNSGIPPLALLKLIADLNIDPCWYQIALPNGPLYFSSYISSPGPMADSTDQKINLSQAKITSKDTDTDKLQCRTISSSLPACL